MLFLSVGLAAVVVVAIAITAAAYTTRARALGSLRPCDRPEDLGLFTAAVAFLRECAASIAAVALVPFGWIGSEAIDPETDRAVILIHDLGLNAGAFALLRYRLRRDGWRTVICLRHPSTLTDTAAIASRLEEVVEAIGATRARHIALIGHGFGGLVARFYAARYEAPLVRRIVTLGTAHKGSIVPRGRAADLLRPDGPLLTELRAGNQLPREIDVIALHSTFDATVLPPANAEYPRAFNIRVNDAGHKTLLFSRKVYQLIAENLAARLPDSTEEVFSTARLLEPRP